MRLRLRARLAHVLGAVRLPEAVFALRRRGRPAWLTVLNYHRVNVKEAGADVDEGVIDVVPEGFERQLELVREHFTPVALADVLALLEGAEPPPNPVLVTFDDGYRDNLEIAVPLLRRHGIRATFFIATGYVSGRRLFWWDRIAWTVKHARHRRFRLEYPEVQEVDLETAGACERLLQVVKDCRRLDLGRFLADLAGASAAPWTSSVESALVDRLVMRWDDVRALRSAGMDVGSHTRTHRVLQTLPAEALAGELEGSRADLEAELDEPVRAIAYPVGGPVRDHPAILQALQAAGYRVGFSYGTGLQPLARLDPFDVRRVAADAATSHAHFRLMLSLPRLAGFSTMV
jgi:peptidoglycan/xylan/chitin deacetylase (PgdA/CDA1 family)